MSIAAMTTPELIGKIYAFTDAEELKAWAQERANELAASPDREELRAAYRLSFQRLSWGCPSEECFKCMVKHPGLRELGGELCNMCAKGETHSR